MKQNPPVKLTKLTALILAVMLLILPFASGCTQKQPSDDPGDKSKQSAQKEKVTNVFRSKMISFPEKSRSNSDSASVYNGRIYMILSETISEDPYETRTMIYSTDMNGENPESEEYIPHFEGGNLNKFFFLTDGSQIFLEAYYDQDTGSQYNYLIKEDVNGETIFSVELSSMFPDNSGNEMFGYIPWVSINSIYIDSDNIIYVIGDSAVVVLSSDGQKLFDIPIDTYLNYSMMIGGKVAVAYSDRQTWESICKYIDVENKTFGETVTLPADVNRNGNNKILSKAPNDTSDYILYYKTDIGFYGVTDTGTTEIVNWLNSDISPNQVYNIIVLEDGKLFYQGSDMVTYDSLAVFLTKIPDDEVKEKYVIDLAYSNNGGYYDVINFISRFNQESEDYRIRLVDYSVNDPSSEVTSNDLLTRDINVGKIPDMFLFKYDFNGDNFEDKGLFVDFYELMDADPDMPRSSFTKYVKEPFETNGKLYKLADQIYIDTYIARTDTVGTKNSMSISEMLDILEKNSDLDMMYGIARTWFFSSVSKGLNEFIDYDQGTCTFSSDTFIRMLNYAAALPEEYDYSDNTLYETGLQQEKVLLQSVSISTFIDYLRNKVSMGDIETTYVGYPGTDGGTTFSAGCLYSISAKSEPELQQGAWEFLKYIITVQAESESMMRMRGFPATYYGYQKMAESEMKMYYLIMDRGMAGSYEKFTDEDIAANGGGTQVNVTQADVDEILKLIESQKPAKPIDDKIMEIINEEASSFFGGAKTAKETADIIQSRVSIYLSE